MWTELSEAKRRRDLSEERDYVHVLDPPLGVGVVLGPKTNELVQMMGTQDGPIPVLVQSNKGLCP